MSALAFAFRRTFKKPAFSALLLLCALAVFLASLSGAAGEQPPAGVCDLDGSPESQRMVDWLLENGYQLYDDPAEMRALVETGELDGALVLPEGLSRRIRAGELEGALPFLVSPASYAPELYRSHAAAALFREAAPYVTAAAFAGTSVTEEEVLDEYFALFESGYAFAFQVTAENGTAIPDSARSRALVMGAAAVLLCALLLTAPAEELSGDFPGLLCRLGAKTALTKVLLPSLAVRALCAFAAAALGLLAGYLAGGGGYCLALLFPVFLYTGLLGAAGVLLAAALPGKGAGRLLLPLVLMASLALCPIFTDVTLLIPALGPVRWLLPCYWLWLIAERPLVWLAVTAAALLLAPAALSLRLGRTGNSGCEN
ncbi:MAG: hypothetical protein ACI4PC_06015 [Oscillospiraceae bacterium]